MHLKQCLRTSLRRTQYLTLNITTLFISIGFALISIDADSFSQLLCFMLIAINVHGNVCSLTLAHFFSHARFCANTNQPIWPKTSSSLSTVNKHVAPRVPNGLPNRPAQQLDLAKNVVQGINCQQTFCNRYQNCTPPAGSYGFCFSTLNNLLHRKCCANTS